MTKKQIDDLNHLLGQAWMTHRKIRALGKDCTVSRRGGISGLKGYEIMIREPKNETSTYTLGKDALLVDTEEGFSRSECFIGWAQLLLENK